jgi:hypothetical protein
VTTTEPREVKIGQERWFLLLSDHHEGRSTRSARGDLEWLHAHLALPYLRADAQVWLTDPAIESSLTSFIRDLAVQWRGWEGVKEWTAYEGGLALSCAHDGHGHITMTAELRERSNHGWLVRGDVPLDAGQLDTVALELSLFFDRG